MKKILPFLLLFTCFISCRKEEKVPINIDCIAFTEALKTDDYAAVEKQVNAFFDSRTPMPTEFDSEGYKPHFQELADQIDACEELTINYSCYECLQTAPPTGHIIFSFFVNGQEVSRTMYTRYDKNIKQYHFTVLF